MSSGSAFNFIDKILSLIDAVQLSFEPQTRSDISELQEHRFAVYGVLLPAADGAAVLFHEQCLQKWFALKWLARPTRVTKSDIEHVEPPSSGLSSPLLQLL